MKRFALILMNGGCMLLLFDTVNIDLGLGIKKWEQKSQEVENLLAFDFLYVVNVSASRVLPLEVQAVFTEDLVEFF